MKHQNHRIIYKPEPQEPAPHRTSFWEYFAGACLGACLAVLILHAMGALFI